MDTDEARSLYSRRKELNEPTFGIIKDQMNVRQFLLRGLRNVQAEFSLLATAFNLRSLYQVWSKMEGMFGNFWPPLKYKMIFQSPWLLH